MEHKYREEVAEIVKLYRLNNEEYALLEARVVETRRTLVELENTRKALFATRQDIRKKELSLFDEMAAAGVDVEKFKANILNTIKNTKEDELVK